LDIATTAGNVLKVRMAAQQGERVPEGIILNRVGQPVTDPGEFLEGGLMAPLGSPHVPHKGFGLALLIDVLSGVLSGSGFAQGMTTDAPGNFLWALDVDAFMPRDEFLKRMDEQLDQIKHGERLPGVGELVAPGERGQRRWLELTARGVVPISPASWDVLVTSCDSLSVSPPVLERSTTDGDRLA
jgi:uncharacterized oxidoreductase